MARPASSIPFTADGWIEALTVKETMQSPEDAWAKVLSQTPYLTPEDRALAMDEKAFIRPPEAYRTGFHIASDIRVVVVQGGWWYRGVTAVQPEGSGATVTYVVVNVAPGWTRWIAHWFQARRYRT